MGSQFNGRLLAANLLSIIRQVGWVIPTRDGKQNVFRPTNLLNVVSEYTAMGEYQPAKKNKGEHPQSLMLTHFQRGTLACRQIVFFLSSKEGLFQLVRKTSAGAVQIVGPVYIPNKIILSGGSAALVHNVIFFQRYPFLQSPFQ